MRKAIIAILVFNCLGLSAQNKDRHLVRPFLKSVGFNFDLPKGWQLFGGDTIEYSVVMDSFFKSLSYVGTDINNHFEAINFYITPNERLFTRKFLSFSKSEPLIVYGDSWEFQVDSAELKSIQSIAERYPENIDDGNSIRTDVLITHLGPAGYPESCSLTYLYPGNDWLVTVSFVCEYKTCIADFAWFDKLSKTFGFPEEKRWK